MSKTVVIGSGLAGMLYHHFYPDSLLVGDNFSIGTQVFPLGPRYVHYNIKVGNFLASLGLDTGVYQVNVGYVMERQFVEPSDDFKKQYLIKTRGEGAKEGGLVTDLTKHFSIFGASHEDLYKALMTDAFKNVDNNMVVGRVSTIDFEEQEVTYHTVPDVPNKVIHYDDLIVTIPQPAFLNMIGYHLQDLKWNSVLYELHLMEQEWFWKRCVDFAYVADSSSPYHRITAWDKPLTVTETICNTNLPRGASECWQKYGKIISGTPQKIHDVRFFGRWAEWKNKLMVSDLIRTLIKEAWA